MILKLKTGPAQEPISLAEAKFQCRVDGVEEDALLARLIKVAREYVEVICGPLITQTWEQFEDAWPSGEELRLAPRVQSVSKIEYTPLGAATQELAAASYSVDILNEYKPRVVLKDGYDWPSDELEKVNPIKLTLVRGYGDSGDQVPEKLRQAMLLLVAHWYEERQPAAVGRSVQYLDWSVDSLMAEYRIW